MKPLLIISVLSLTLAGCTRTLYVPNSLNTPLFEHKNDYKLVIGSKLIAPPNLEIQAAYAPLKHLLVMGNGSYFSFKNNDRQTCFEHYLAEGGAGLFTAFWKNRCDNKIARAAFMGGWGIGGADITRNPISFFSPPTLFEHDGSYDRKFVQAVLGLRFEKLDFSVAARFSEINFWDYNDFENGLPTQSGTYRFTTLEPVATLAYGWNGFRLHMQGGMASGYGSDFHDATGDAWGNLHLNIGFAFVNKMEDCPLVPPISLIREPDNIRFPPPPAVLQVRQSMVTICLSDGGDFDGDEISASLNGSYVLNDVVLRKKPICFEANLQPNSENILQIHAISNGELSPNTLKITIKDGRKSRSFYLLTEAGKTEAMRLRLE